MQVYLEGSSGHRAAKLLILRNDPFKMCLNVAMPCSESITGNTEHNYNTNTCERKVGPFEDDILTGPAVKIR